MTDGFNPDNVHEIWQNQHTEGRVMSVEELRGRIERSKTRQRRFRRRGIAGAAGYLAVHIVDILLPSLHPWLFPAMLLFWSLWAIHSLNLGWESGLQPKFFLTLGLGEKSSSCVDFYRNELHARRDRVRRGRKAIPWIAVFLASLTFFAWWHRPEMTIFFAPPILLLVVWCAVIKRTAPGIQEELDEFEAVERQQR